MKTMMNYPHETATDDPLLQPAVFAVLQFRGLKGEIPAGLQKLQTANGGIHLQKHITDNIMNEYRFHH